MAGGGMAPSDIGTVVSASDPRVSPDGTLVAFVVNRVDLEANEYRSGVWMAATDGSARPRPFTSGTRRDARPRWAPDGRALAFVSHRGGPEGGPGSTVHVMAVDAGGEPVTVATWPEEVEDLAWSPDGTTLALVARRRDEARYAHDRERDQPPRRIDRLFFRHDDVGWTTDRPRHVLVVAADGSSPPRPVTAGPFEHAGLAWSPDGRWLATTAGRHETWDLDRATDLYRVPAAGGDSGGGGGGGDGGEPERLTPTGLDYGLPSWSPDATRLAVLRWDPMSSPRHAVVAVVDAAGAGAPRPLTGSLDRNCAPYPPAREPIWDGADLLFAVEDAGNVHLYRVAADGSASPELVVGGTREVTGWDLAGGVLAFCASTPTEPADIFVQRPGHDEMRLTRFGSGLARTAELVPPERFVATSADGSEVEAWLMRPPGFDDRRSYPVLLNVHGGPFTQYGNVFFDEFQIQAGAGYAVLYANPRGSSGYSEAWGRAIRGPKAADDPGSGWGGVDYEDLMAVVDGALARFDFLDGTRMGMLGGSYGGYMATWMAGHTDRFRAVCSERAVNNLLTLEQTSDVASGFSAQIGVSHLDDPGEYLRQSPVTYVRDIAIPMLLVHSEQDLRCPVSQAEELFVALRLLGRPVELVRFPGESHELSRSGSPRHRVQRAEIILEFFDRHLKPPRP